MPATRLLILLLLSIFAKGAFAYDLTQHLWRDRLLFLVAPSAEDRTLLHKRGEIDRRDDALVDRDMVFFQINADQGSRGELVLDASQVQQLRDQLNVERHDRVMILVGKDGGIKRRAPLEADLREIFLQVDTMPMRQTEIRSKKRAGEKVTLP